MKRFGLFALMMALVLVVTGCSLVVKDPAVDAKRIIIDFGDEKVDKATFINAYNNAYNNEMSMQQMYQQFGMIQQVNVDPAQIMQQTMDGMVNRMVLLKRAKELKLDVLTDEEKTALAEKVEESWQAVLDEVQQYDFAQTELTGDELTAAVAARAAEYGISREAVEASEAETRMLEKLKVEETKDVAVTQEEIKADFDTKVEGAKAQYTSDPDAYGSAFNAGGPVYYAPAGYRLIKQVLVKFLSEDQTVIDQAQSAVRTAQTALTTAQNEVTANTAAMDAEGITEEEKATLKGKGGELDKTLAEAMAALDAANLKLTEAKDMGYANIKAKADEIVAKARGGESFDALMEQFNEDTGTPQTGYAVREGFASFDAAFVTPAMALDKAGDVSDPSPGVYGYYIVQYAGDVAEGPVALDGVQQGIQDELLTARQDETYAALTAEWVAASGIKTYMDRVTD